MSSSTLPRPRGIIRSSIALVSTLALATVLTACGSDDGGSDSAGDSGSGDDSGITTVADGTLTVCSDVPYPPFEDFDETSESGFKGFDIDIVQAIADGLELELAVKDSSFDALQSGQALNAAQCDIAASAMTITEERKAALDFSDGYYDSQQSLLVAEGSDIASIDDLDGVKVGVQQGTTGKAYAEENATGAELVSFPSDAEMFQAIKAGQVDALLQDLPVNINHQDQGGFSVVETYSTDESYGLAMKKGNTALVEAVNEQLSEMRDDGTYDEIYNSYFATE
ncbi:basic amino acid ABC transporter substrate-binding protein [Nocardioides flavus (ex Wang et al. 2016)]|uniref:Basic amino acid ABC transporter substrate-binding protein n=1 Tax=Nocardioides flavus (ex Wang et al. 2016) TaxID=2058780 RepID=A0ABQ3HL84_9ACTN|nr:transporter substrate-binding domain-containing protein [Nocardioides flavus (ex Wang et al. 2016)]GHE18425.1 basic amino acid ABC transporter substrate-binding protein [Nocardioides flavus (ex Wang et al. 2016)]